MPSGAARDSRGIVEGRITAPPISREDMPCFVIFSQLLRPSFFSPLRSFPMMPTPVAVAVVAVFAAVEEACGPGASTVAAIVAARFTPAGSTAVEDTAIASEAHARAIRSPVVRAVQVTPLPVGQVVRSPAIRAVRSLVIPATATAAQPTVLPPAPPHSEPMDTITTTTTTAVIRTPTAIGSVRNILTSIDTENALPTVGTVVR
ncbi:hypothetical protein XI08_28900 [Bradyrhizobium sp. CCBAU 11361]|nr:hypothetical protein [Bradyrhizobium sp. CCBAU 11361]